MNSSVLPSNTSQGIHHCRLCMCTLQQTASIVWPPTRFKGKQGTEQASEEQTMIQRAGLRLTDGILGAWDLLSDDRHCCAPQCARIEGLAYYGNDPAAGSPTATLLRLLHPLASEHWADSLDKQCDPPVLALETSILTPSVATTGGVYKWQGHNRYGLMNHAY